jgi:hypothetical protein
MKTEYILMGAIILALLAAFAVIGVMYRRLVASIEHMEHKFSILRRSERAYSVAGQEAYRVTLSFRDLFERLDSHVQIDPKMQELLARVSEYLTLAVRCAPFNLMRWDGQSAMPMLEGRERALAKQIESLVQDINDPVLKQLWVAGTPSDCSEMLRHGFFLALGYPNAVTMSSLEGVRLEWPTAPRQDLFKPADAPVVIQPGPMLKNWQQAMNDLKLSAL